MSTQTFLLYLATWSLVAVTPGPAVMCSMAQSTRHGFRASLAGISGIQLGNFLFFVCVGLGLGTLLATASTAFTLLRIAGAIYLFYLSIRILMSSFRRMANADRPAANPAFARSSLFLQGLLVQLTNPKALLFVSALLPQFIEPDRHVPWQLTLLLLATIAVDTLVLSSYAYLAQAGARSFRSTHLSRWLERAFGAALLFFGVRLLSVRK